MRRLAWFLVLVGCTPPIGAPPPSSVEPRPATHRPTPACEPREDPSWERIATRIPALLEHQQTDRAAERFATLRSWLPEGGRTTVWLRAEGGVVCHPVDVGLSAERVRGRRRTDETEGDRRRQTMSTVVLDPWGISAWFQSREGVRDGDDWRWAPYEHVMLPMHTARHLSAIDDRVAVYGGSTYRLTTTCARREVLHQQCTNGQTRRCPQCAEIGLRTIETTRSRAHPLELPRTVVPEANVDCSAACPADPDAPYRAELDALLATRVFYRDGGDGPRVYRHEEDCSAAVGAMSAESAPWHDFP